MKHFVLTLLINIMFLGIGFPAHAELSDENEPSQYVYARVLANQTNVSGGETVRLGLEQIIHPKWHTYWKNPGDSGLPTSISWTLPEGFEVSELEWPTPQKIPFEPLTNYGYEGSVVLLQDLKVPADVGDMPIQLKGTVDLLVCHDICIPESHDVSIILNGTTPAEPDVIDAAEKKLPKEIISGAKYYEQNNDLVFEIKNDGRFQNIDEITLLPKTWGGVHNSAKADFTLNDNKLTITQQKAEGDGQELATYPVLVHISNKDGSEFVFSIDAEKTNSPATPAAKNDSENSFAKFIQAILFAIFGGMILNLMPCVFPVLSMKALSLVKLKSEEEREAREHGLAYTAGILLSFAIIGGTLVILKAAGAEIGWGFQLQNSLIIVLLTYLVFVIGLNLAGYFEFSNRLAGIGQKQAQENGKKGAFFTGVLATLVATPCTAPFMGVALGYALTQNAVISMSVFLALGFGLALPYLALCYIPSLRSKLPKPGLWMDQFKQALAFPMFLTAAWLIWVLAQQGGSMATLCALIGMVFIAFSFWLHKNFLTDGKKNKVALVFLVISLITIAGTLAVTETPMTNDPMQSETMITGKNWEEFSSDKLETLLEGDQPVFINMTAAWCITCQVNDRVALKRQATKKLFAENDIAYLKGDWTLKDAEITKYLNQFGRQGVPMYVYYGPRDSKTNERPDPVLLPQILTASIVEDVIRKP